MNAAENTEIKLFPTFSKIKEVIIQLLTAQGVEEN
jgi:hypothetical protein